MNKALLLYLVLLLCYAPGLAQPKQDVNPPALGFDKAGSDPRAIQTADDVMKAMGGRAAWNDTQLIAWTFNGLRRLVWDKWSGNVRIDNLLDDQTVLLNIKNRLGRVYRHGEEVLEADSVTKYVQQGRQDWIHDSYWLLLPFRLKDSGVTLRYLGIEPTQVGTLSDVLQLTMKHNSLTPGTRHKVWVDKKTRLIRQWAYFPNRLDKQPSFTLPWDDYRQHGTILLASNRGSYRLSNIMVFSGLPGEVFSDFTRTDLSRYPGIK